MDTDSVELRRRCAADATRRQAQRDSTSGAASGGAAPATTRVPGVLAALPRACGAAERLKSVTEARRKQDVEDCWEAVISESEEVVGLRYPDQPDDANPPPPPPKRSVGLIGTSASCSATG